MERDQGDEDIDRKLKRVKEKKKHPTLVLMKAG